MEFKPLNRVQRKAFRRKWIKALRSGKYKQGHGALNRGNKYCCLGVACDLFAKQYPGVMTIGKSIAVPGETTFDGGCSYLPEIVRRALGVRTNSGSMVDTSLTCMNDSGKSDFRDIAATIASRQPGLLVKRELR